jgi:hypothetical protein
VGVPLNDGEFYGQYFAAEGIPIFVVLGVKRIFEEVLDEDLSRLRPGDGLGDYFGQADDLADVDFLEKCEGEFGIKLTQADADRMTTFRSVVQIIWEKVRLKEA